MLRGLLICITVGVLLSITVGVSVSEEFAAHRPALGLPGSGGMISAEGSLDVAGVSQMNIPVAYTLHQKQRCWGLFWSDDEESDDITGLLSLSLGRSEPGHGLSITGLIMEREGLSGAIQKQLWAETGKWPAIAVGFYDVTDRVDRGGYVVATRQLGGARRRQLELGWPPDEVSAVSADDPRTWGQVIISPEPRGPAPTLPAARHLLTVPLLPSTPRLDGVMGVGEWDEAAAQVHHFAPGEEMMVMAGHDELHLYVCLSVPSDHGLGAGYAAELLLEVPQRGVAELNQSHRRYAAEVVRAGETVKSFSQGHQGEWVRPGESGDGASVFSAVASGGGDGAWRWPVFEFAVPLAELRAGDGQLTALGFAARISLPAGGAHQAGARKSADIVRFPAGRSSYRSPYNHVFPTRPDLWGTAVFGDVPLTSSTVSVTVISEDVQVDGQLNESAWQQAAATSYTVFGDATQTVRVLADDHYLYVGVRCQMNRGQQTRRRCEVYLDPLGDEGLMPRADDRLYRFDEATRETECFQWADDSWSAPRASRFTAAGHSSIEDKQMIDTYEFAIPRRELTRPAADARLGLAVQTQYEARPAPRFVEQMPAKAYLTAGWGGGPFSGHGFAGLSLRAGDGARGIVEYDGEGFNLGYITRPSGSKYNLMLGIRNFAGYYDSRFVVGLSQRSEF